jgi:cyclase
VGNRGGFRLTAAETPYVQTETVSRPRVIVALTTSGGRLVKTRRFRNPRYIGDPINAVRIFSEKGADEIILLEIGGRPFDSATEQSIRRIAEESSVPIGYGGGLRSVEHCRRVIQGGFEKVVLNTILHTDLRVASRASSEFGSQAIIASIDIRSTWLGGERVVTHCGQRATSDHPVEWAARCQDAGCGEILVTSIDADGGMCGYDLPLVTAVSTSVSTPVIARGGAGTIQHMSEAISAGASAVAASSMFVYYGALRGVLLTYPDHPTLGRLRASPDQPPGGVQPSGSEGG